MISIVNNTTEQASKLGTSIQLDLNKQAISAYVLNLIYITQQFLYSSHGHCFALTELPQQF